MVIQKAGRGRPSRRFILEQVDLGMRDLARTGGLPSPVESAAIWRDIWYEEAHNSTAIEGNTLALKQVRILLDEGRPVGNKELNAHFAEMATPVRAKWPPRIGVLATPSEAASAADAGRPRHPLILTSSRCVAGLVAG